MCHNWKLLSSSTAQSSGRDLAKLVQQAAADIAAQPGAESLGLEYGGGHGRRGRFAVRAGDADHPGRAGPEEEADFRIDFCPGLPGDFQHWIAGPDRRIDHHEFRIMKVLFPMSPQVQPGDVYVLQPVQRIGQCLFLGDVGHGDFRALSGQPSSGGRPTAEASQAHNRHPPPTIVAVHVLK